VALLKCHLQYSMVALHVLLQLAMLQNNWLTIVAKYPSATMTMELRVGSVVDVQTNTALRTDRSVDLTYIGRSSRAQDPYLSGKIAGLYALDALLSDVEISELSNKIY